MSGNAGHSRIIIVMVTKSRFFTLLSAFLLLVMTTLLLLPRRFGLPTQSLNGTTVQITVVRYLYHTGIIVPVRAAQHDWSEIFPCVKGKRFVEIAWGDRDFYMSGSVTVGLALKALFFSEASVLNVNGFDALPSEEQFANEPFAKKKLLVSEEYYQQMVHQMLQSVALYKHQAVFLREGFWGGASAFYKADTGQTGSYSIVNNCNVWSARALDAAGIAVPLWSGIPHPLMWMLPNKQF